MKIVIKRDTAHKQKQDNTTQYNTIQYNTIHSAISKLQSLIQYCAKHNNESYSINYNKNNI